MRLFFSDLCDLTAICSKIAANLFISFSCTDDIQIFERYICPHLIYYFSPLVSLSLSLSLSLSAFPTYEEAECSEQARSSDANERMSDANSAKLPISITHIASRCMNFLPVLPKRERMG